MIQLICLYTIEKILNLLRKNPDFFSLDKGGREELIKELPESIQSYLENSSEKEFMAELKEATLLIRGENYSNSSNKLMQMASRYITNELAKLMDRLPVEFYNLSISEKAEFLQEKMKLPQVLVDVFSTNSYQDIFEKCYGFISKIQKDTPYIVVQMARDPEGKVKSEMRQHFKSKFEQAFPKFQISKNLLGGMRVLVNGQILDQSWRGKIERFTSQLSLTK